MKKKPAGSQSRPNGLLHSSPPLGASPPPSLGRPPVTRLSCQSTGPGLPSTSKVKEQAPCAWGCAARARAGAPEHQPEEWPCYHCNCAGAAYHGMIPRREGGRVEGGGVRPARGRRRRQLVGNGEGGPANGCTRHTGQWPAATAV